MQKLDTLASDTFVDTLSSSGRVAAIGSEEIAETVVVGDEPQHRYLVQMDPLDGSSNIDPAYPPRKGYRRPQRVNCLAARS